MFEGLPHEHILFFWLQNLARSDRLAWGKIELINLGPGVKMQLIHIDI